ncbi:DNA repair protein RadA [Arcanobacterium hippocoleae]|uniref:DNA repair protein RadA n=1 Tax=Arcanobacterium hippocoleae TaxID=149017 RepID=UPI00333EF404
MAKNKTNYVCTECGWSTTKWVGRCSECLAWGTVEEFRESRKSSFLKGGALAPTSPAQPITEVSAQASTKHPTGVPELDRVLGGGLVAGVVVLIAGEPGVGKSTLLLDVAAKAAAQRSLGRNAPVLYISGEESAAQVRSRAERIGALNPNLLLASESDLAALFAHVAAVNPALLIIDSVQTIADTQVEGAAGGVAQVRAVTAALVNLAKTTGLPTILVGHVNKEGSIAGPRVLEHLVDVVCQFEGDRHSRLRLVRAIKNRYGATDEVGCFELVDAGIRGLADPSGLFLSARNLTVPGTCVTVTLEGRRPMPVEIQALSVNPAGPPRRVSVGVDNSRVAMMLAVIQSRLGVAFERCDVFVSTVGGARAIEPAADLAVALALASASANQPLAPGVIALGEVSLTGELRPVIGLQQRLNEAGRLGFKIALVPPYADPIKVPQGMKIWQVQDLRDSAEKVLALA